MPNRYTMNHFSKKNKVSLYPRQRQEKSDGTRKFVKKIKESSKATLVKEATSKMHATTRPNYLVSKVCSLWQNIGKQVVRLPSKTLKFFVRRVPQAFVECVEKTRTATCLMHGKLKTHKRGFVQTNRGTEVDGRNNQE